MADYIYLLENRLSETQQKAILAVRELARAKGLTVFLVGGAVRDLTSGSPVRDLDVVVQGNALKLKKDLEKIGAAISGEADQLQALYLRFPGGVRMEIGSTLTVTYPKPGKPSVKPATILEDLRRRDFTANAMALSLNQGSYGLLMDPLNGVADIENRELRLVSNYGFIEDPVRMIRAQRLAARLGWQLEEKTQGRYETGKAEGYISALDQFHRGYEAEEIVHEEDPLRVMRRLESEGWMKILAPAWNSSKANVVELERLREAQMQLQMQGIHADPSAAQFPLLTAKMPSRDVAELKKSFPRHGFAAEIAALEADARRLAAELTSKQASTPSATWKMLASASPEVVLWVAYSTRSAGLQAKFKSFYTEWPQAKQKIPYTLMQEMRIVPELPGYDLLVEKLFFQLMDGRLSAPEEMKAYLEPHSPPAPPPPVNLRRARAAKSAKAKSRKKAEAEDGAEDPEAAAPAGTPADAPALAIAAEAVPPPVKAGPPAPRPVEPRPAPPVKTPAPVAQKAAAVAPAASRAASAKAAVKPLPAKAAAASAPSARTLAAKSMPSRRAAPGKKIAAKAPSKAAPPKAPAPKLARGKIPAKKSAPVKTAPRAPRKPAPRKAPAKAAPPKPAAKFAAGKPVPKTPSRPPAKSAPARKTAAKTHAKKRR